MPIQEKDLGRYRRPDIYINEIDNSVVELPVQDVLVNLVPGFSKKGPVNRPLFISSPAQFTTIFGDIDRQLENKGSFYHRTAIKMLESGPIHALNLLLTDDNRDQLEWQSISVSSSLDNGTEKLSPYTSFFNRQDFWERDSEMFLYNVMNPTPDYDRMLHFTNMGEKTVTVFVFKSSAPGFDITAEDWYGGASKVPLYINAKDWISDYILNVIIAQGDWSDYATLANDARWGQYFSASGLMKTQVDNFLLDTNVTILGDYYGSLLPYFKDIQGNDMYIKNIINNNTDRHGLFCAYNEDYILSSDYYTGKMDIIGDTMVGNAKSTINFMSYNETITEDVTYTQKLLNSLGNTFGNYSADMYSSPMSTGCTDTIGSRGLGTYTDGYVYQISGVTTSTGFANVASYDLSSITFTASATTMSAGKFIMFNKAFDVITSTNVYKLVSTSDPLNLTFIIQEYINSAWTNVDLSATGTTTSTFAYYYSTDVNPYGGTTTFKFNIGTEQFEIDVTGYTNGILNTSVILPPFTTLVNNSGVTASRYDVLYLTKNATNISVLSGQEIYGSTGSTLPNFLLSTTDTIILGYIKSDYINGALTSSYVGVSVDSLTSDFYKPLSISITSGFTSTNNYLTLTFAGTSGSPDYKNYNKLRLLKAYTQLSTKLATGQAVIIRGTDGYKYPVISPTIISQTTTSDAAIRIYFSLTEDVNNYFTNSTYSKFLLYFIDDEFVVSSDNVIMCDYLETKYEKWSESPAGHCVGIVARYSSFYINYYNGLINNNDYFTNKNSSALPGELIYLDMFIGNDNHLRVDFISDPSQMITTVVDNWTAATGTTGGGYGSHFDIISHKGSWQQTLEVVDYQGVDIAHVQMISVDKIRYSEITKGTFLEAYYDENYYATPALVAAGAVPKKLTRIIKVLNDPNDSNLKQLYTDLPIKLTDNTESGITYTTTAFMSIDVYVSTYKGLSFAPFVISTESIPNGTETRMNDILNVMARTTNLGKGLVNKNKISWRYLVDSFGLGLQEKSKQVYLDVCGEKKNCLGFISMPSAKMFRDSINPNFIEKNELGIKTGALSTAYIKAGGDESENPNFLYTFGTGVGQSCVGYFFPYVYISDNQIPRRVPPAAYAATTYMQKFVGRTAGVRPWTVCAGVDFGRVNGIIRGEMDFSDTDLENLDQMGCNPITYRTGYGWCINSENTAQVYPYSSFSILHAREVLIELENKVYDMLLKYQWKFNTVETRSEIKYKADKICKELLDQGALYDFNTVCDTTNNTDYIIDLQMGTLDIFCEIVKAMGKIVCNLTVLKKGAIQAGGFSPA